MINEWGWETVLHLGSSYSASETNVLNVTKQNAGKSINISHAKLHYLLDLSTILLFFPLHQTAFASGSISSTFKMQDTSSNMLNLLYSLMRSLVPSPKANFFAPWWLLGAKNAPNWQWTWFALLGRTVHHISDTVHHRCKYRTHSLLCTSNIKPWKWTLFFFSVSTYE